jgi:hypothetical protein
LLSDTVLIATAIAIPMAIATPKTRMVALILNFGMSQPPMAPSVCAAAHEFFSAAIAPIPRLQLT